MWRGGGGSGVAKRRKRKGKRKIKKERGEGKVFSGLATFRIIISLALRHFKWVLKIIYLWIQYEKYNRFFIEMILFFNGWKIKFKYLSSLSESSSDQGVGGGAEIAAITVIRLGHKEKLWPKNLDCRQTVTQDCDNWIKYGDLHCVSACLCLSPHTTQYHCNWLYKQCHRKDFSYLNDFLMCFNVKTSMPCELKALTNLI